MAEEALARAREIAARLSGRSLILGFLFLLIIDCEFYSQEDYPAVLIWGRERIGGKTKVVRADLDVRNI
jgi:hypothetical protein